MARRWAVGAAAAAVLVVAVLASRPGSSATEDDLALPEPSRSPVVDARLPGPDQLEGTGIADLPVDAGGFGPLQLGTTQEDLVAAGWQLRYGAGSCVRVLPVWGDDVALGGWLVDGDLVSVQAELTGLRPPGTETGLGFRFGGTIDGLSPEMWSPGVVLAGDAGPTVRTAGRLALGVEVVVSDLGTESIRLAEVRRAAGEGCELVPDVLDALSTPTEAAVLAQAAPGQAGGSVGGQPDLVGTDLAALAGTGWAPQAAGLSGDGCERVEQTAADGRTELSLFDGVVVAHRWTREAAPTAGPPGSRPEERFVVDAEGDLVRRSLVTSSSSGPAVPGTSSGTRPRSTTSEHVVQVVRELDTTVVVQGPVPVEQLSGVPCPAGP